MIERYLHQSKVLRAVFLLIDIRHEPSANDRAMYDWILNNGFQPIIIATKLDKLKKSQVSKHVKMIKQGLQVVEGLRSCLFITDKAGAGRDPGTDRNVYDDGTRGIVTYGSISGIEGYCRRFKFEDSLELL